MQTSDRTFYAHTFSLVALFLVGYLLYLVLWPLLVPIAWAAFIAFLIYPLHARLTRRLRGRAALSAALVTTAVFLLVIGPLAGLGTAFAAQVTELARRAQSFAVEHRPSDFSDFASLPVVGPALAWVQETAGVSLAQMQTWAVDAAQTVLKVLGSLGRAAFLGALGTVVGFALMMFILFFAIRDGRAMSGALRELMPVDEKDKARLFNHLAAVTRALVYGTGVTALVQGALTGIGFALTGLPSPVVF